MKEETESSVVCHHRVGFLGLLITLGIVFGDIGTSPLYVMKAILHTRDNYALTEQKSTQITIKLRKKVDEDNLRRHTLVYRY